MRPDRRNAVGSATGFLVSAGDHILTYTKKELGSLTLLNSFHYVFYFSKTVCLSTGVVKATKAFSTNFLRNFFSSAGSKAGLPNGWGIAIVGTILLAPTVKEIGVTVHI